MSDRRPEGFDPLEPLDRRVEHLERRDVVERDKRARAALRGAELVEDAVLGHLEETGRELAAERELRQALEDPQEDLLRQILGERAVTVDEPEDVAVERQRVRPQDDD